MQMHLYSPPIKYTPPKMADLPSWANANRVAIDLETYDPQLRELGPGVRRGGYIAGISFSVQGAGAYYLPIRHADDNLPLDEVFNYLHAQRTHFHGELIGANLQYDLDYLWNSAHSFGITDKQKTIDVQVVESLIDEFRPRYGLDYLAKYHGIKGKDEGGLEDAAKFYQLDKKKGIASLPARFVAEYAIRDVTLCLEIYAKQEKIIKDRKLEKVLDMECALLPLLLKMRRRGVRVDNDRLDQIEKWAAEQVDIELEKIDADHFGWDELTLPSELARVLRRAIPDIKIPRTPKTDKDSIDIEFLNSLDHPVATSLVRARKFLKLKDASVQAVREHETDGRIHATFHQSKGGAAFDTDDESGAAFGRLSCTHTNLQNQYARDEEIGQKWRCIYIPDEGKQWASIDYGGQEPRLATHFAVIAGCTGAEEFAYKWQQNPKMNMHKEVGDMCNIGKDAAKEINLGTIYGMGGGKLCKKLGLPTEEAFIYGKMRTVAGPEGKALMAEHERRFPFLKQLAKMAARRAEEVGYVRTILGRHCHFEDVGGEYQDTHKALNRVVQGSAADQLKKSLIACDRAGKEIQVPVHDELCLSVANEEEAYKVRDIMVKSLDLLVPSVCDVAIGKSWGTAE